MKKLLLLAALSLGACTTPCDELDSNCERCSDFYEEAACELVVATGDKGYCEVLLDELERPTARCSWCSCKCSRTAG